MPMYNRKRIKNHRLLSRREAQPGKIAEDQR